MTHSPKSKRRAPKSKTKRMRATLADESIRTMSPAGFDALIALVCNPPKLSSTAQARYARKRVWE